MVARTRVLVVEDEPLIAMDIAVTLEELGCEVLGYAQTVAEAMAQIAALAPDLVTLDVNLGRGQEGLGIATDLRAAGLTPILFVTGQGERGIAEFARDLGRAAVALKPISTLMIERALMSLAA
jgi:AmiR/NasT family two-component response regulator